MDKLYIVFAVAFCCLGVTANRLRRKVHQKLKVKAPGGNFTPVGERALANGAFGEVWKVHVKSGAKITYASEEFGTQPKPDTDYALKIVVDPDSQTVEGAAAKDGQCASPDILPPELAGFNSVLQRGRHL